MDIERFSTSLKGWWNLLMYETSDPEQESA